MDAVIEGYPFTTRTGKSGTCESDPPENANFAGLPPSRNPARERLHRGNKVAVQTIVERRHGSYPGSKAECTTECPGQAQTIVLAPEADRVDGRSVGANLRKHTDPETTRLMTDESAIYSRVGKAFKSHETVNHKKSEYARTDPMTGRLISTNAAEGLIANLKRQITGTHHSTSKKHLPRYLEEYDFKYNTRERSDTERAEAAIAKMEGKRLTLFKSKSGKGESLFDRKVAEQSKHGTMRGMHSNITTAVASTFCRG